MGRRQAARIGGRATRPETIHITLAFVGDVPEARLPELVAAARAVAGEPSVVEVDRLAHWGHNHICWAGCSRPPPALDRLVAALRQQLLAAGFAVDRAQDAFIPHVTLVRKTHSAAPASVLEPPLHWPVREFVLVRSELGGEGSTYRELARFPLADCSGSAG